MAVTLRDVAERAGVSVRTVSNVVNGFRHVSPDMRERVQAAVTELDYRPNLLARSLRQGRTGLITLLVPEINVGYFGELAHEIIEHARARHWTVLIDETGGDAGRERELLQIASRSALVDGVLFSSLGLGKETSQLQIDVPAVLLGEQVPEAYDHVGIDNVGAARLAVDHLTGLGRRRIAAIGRETVPSADTARQRLRGYRLALEGAGLPYDPVLAPRVGHFHRADGARAMRELLALSVPPDAVFAFNDTLAMGAMRALHEAGYRVPRDVSVVGFDDVEESRYCTPTLTSIAPDKVEIARHAVTMLHERISGDTSSPRRVLVGYALEIRESTARPDRVRLSPTGAVRAGTSRAVAGRR